MYIYMAFFGGRGRFRSRSHGWKDVQTEAKMRIAKRKTIEDDNNARKAAMDSL
jgi:hypothetical protein